MLGEVHKKMGSREKWVKGKRLERRKRVKERKKM